VIEINSIQNFLGSYNTNKSDGTYFSNGYFKDRDTKRQCLKQEMEIVVESDMRMEMK
jgi:hypothetical protein